MDHVTVNPVFIVGTPRSGTSLLRILLNRHPEIGLCEETYFFYYVFHRQRTFGKLEDIENRAFVIDRYLETSRARRLNLDMESMRETLLREGTDYRQLFISLMRFYARYHGKKLYGEKTPHHALEVELLCSLFPDCRLIHLVRDPRDVVASLKRMPWGSSSIAANARLWVNCVTAAERCRERQNFLRVAYESLVRDPAAELQRVCAFLDVQYNSDMLEAGSDNDADRWWFQRSREPVNRSRVEKWRNELTPAQISVIEWIAGSTMNQLGYGLSCEPPGPALRAAALANEARVAVVSRITNLPRLWYHWLAPGQLAAEEAWIDRPGRKAG
jgi:hypothetical protein